MASSTVKDIRLHSVLSSSKGPNCHCCENGHVNRHIVADDTPSVNGVNGVDVHYGSELEDTDKMQELDVVESVAIIGLALKFPQDATSPDSFWEMLINGRSAMTEVPSDRFKIDSFYNANGGKTGTVSSHYLLQICSNRLTDCEL